MTYPTHIFSGYYPTSHCQGIALDKEGGYLYYSFTTLLVKTDLSGKLIGTVDGLVGHLGCIAFDPVRRVVFGSLEYKNDAIGKSILRLLGQDGKLHEGFYVACFDADRINRPDMNAEKDGVLRTAYLSEVYNDYSFPGHRYGCSGIDGITVGPPFGDPTGKPVLTVAYGIYRDNDRTDNDHQVLLSYDADELLSSAQPHLQSAFHTMGPEPLGKYFVYTGNTDWGVQNLEYDSFTGDYLLAVYPGSKPAFQNPFLFIVNGKASPVFAKLTGLNEKGYLLSLKPSPGFTDKEPSGYEFHHGDTGLYSFGDGRYYISHDGRNEQGQYSHVYLYIWDGVSPFHRIDKPERVFPLRKALYRYER